MSQEEIEKLKQELKESLHASAASNEAQLEQSRKILDDNVKSVIEVYSIEVRNLALVSGTVAPFSLSLLVATNVDINTPMLLSGFVLLMLNIIVSQLFIKSLSKNNDKSITRAEVHWLFAGFHQNVVRDTSEDVSKRVLKNYDYAKEINNMNEKLGLSRFNLNIQHLRSKVRLYNSVTNILFMFGCIAIVISVVLNTTLSYLYSFWISISLF